MSVGGIASIRAKCQEKVRKLLKQNSTREQEGAPSPQRWGQDGTGVLDQQYPWDSNSSWPKLPDLAGVCLWGMIVLYYWHQFYK